MLSKILSSKWFPDRKIIAGGVFALVAFYLANASCSTINLCFSPEEQASIAGGIGVLAGYLIPASRADLVKRINDILAKASNYIPTRDREVVKAVILDQPVPAPTPQAQSGGMANPAPAASIGSGGASAAKKLAFLVAAGGLPLAIALQV